MKRVDADQVAVSLAGQWDSHSTTHFAYLRRRLRWQLLLAYVTPLLVLAGFFHFSYQATMREGINTHVKSIAESQRNTVDLFLRERVANLRSALRPGMLRVPPLPGDLDRLLLELSHESTAFVDVGFFTTSGLLVSYAGPYPELQGKDYSHQEWWQQLMTQERPHLISDVYLGFRDRPHFIIAIRGETDGQQFVLRASVDPEKFAEFVGSFHLMAESEAFIVNRLGRRQTLTGAVDLNQVVVMPPRAEGVTLVEGNSEDVDYVSAFAWLQEHDWSLVVRVPRDRAYARLHQARLVLASIMIAALLGIVALVLHSTRRLVERLAAADEARERLRDQLFNAAKLASVGEMAAGVAHEINNPLAIIYEEAGMMKDLLDPAFCPQPDLTEFRERLGAIADAAMRGRSITRKLLTFSRQHDPHLQPTDINTLVDRVLAIKQQEFKLCNIEVVREQSTGLPKVWLSPNEMEQVLLNLLNNARDAIRGAGRVTVRTRLLEGYVHVDVADTGCGITDKQMEKIFFPFFTTKEVGKGTGLGLSISFGIVKSLGGRIEVQSAVGVGTVFTVMLPTKTRRNTDEQPTAAKVDSRGLP